MFLTRHVHFKIDMMDNNIYHRGCNIFIVVVIMETAVLIIYTFPARAHHALFSRLTSQEALKQQTEGLKEHRRPSII